MDAIGPIAFRAVRVIAVALVWDPADTSILSPRLKRARSSTPIPNVWKQPRRCLTSIPTEIEPV